MLSVLFTGCSSNNSSGTGKKVSAKDYPVTVEGVKIESKPSKVVVLSDILADVAIELGYTDQIIGKSSKCNQEELSNVLDLGDDDELNVSKIKELGPKVVIYEYELSDRQENDLKSFDAKLIKIERAKSRNDLERVYTSIGSIFDGAETGFEYAKKDAQNILMTLDDISRIIPRSTSVPATACYLFDESGKTISDGTFSSQVIEAAGVINISKDIKNETIPMDKLKFLNPTWILCDEALKNKLISDQEFTSLDAVKEKRFVEINSDEILRQGQSIIRVATTIAGKVYPDLLKDSPADDIKSDVEGIINSDSSNVLANSEDSDKEVNTELDSSDLQISLGDSGEKVLKVQNRLDDLNYLHIAPNSNFDDVMQQAIKDFQYLNGMSVTGDVDEKFLSKLFSEDAVARPDPARAK